MPSPRKKSNKKLKPKLHIFCEGAKTEPNYLNGYIDTFHSSKRLLNVIQIERTKKNTPLQLVEEAIKLKSNRETPSSDKFWVVYDRESQSKYSNKLHQQALDKAKSNNIEVALTNVCFEVWILLHFKYSNAGYSCYDDLLQNSPLKNEMKRLGITKYDKGDCNLFDLISDKIPTARTNAEKMNSSIIDASPHQSDKPYLLNPYTDVHLLLNKIDTF